MYINCIKNISKKDKAFLIFVLNDASKSPIGDVENYSHISTQIMAQTSKKENKLKKNMKKSENI